MFPFDEFFSKVNLLSYIYQTIYDFLALLHQPTHKPIFIQVSLIADGVIHIMCHHASDLLCGVIFCLNDTVGI